MNPIERSALAAGVAAAALQLAGCGGHVEASETRMAHGVWHGYHAQVRLVVYDLSQPQAPVRQAYALDVAQASQSVRTSLARLMPAASGIGCEPDQKVYVLEITEVGQKRRYSSQNNACDTGLRYAGYLPIAALDALAQAMSAN